MNAAPNTPPVQIHHGDLGTVSQVAPVDKLSVAIAIVLSVVFLGEKLTWHTGLGAAMIIGGTLVLIF